MKGATTAVAGTAGLVPAPAKSYNIRFLRGDGTWQVVNNVSNAGTANYAKNSASATYCGGLTFGKDSEGNWGYKPSGADTVIPFRSGSGSESDTQQLYEALQYSRLVTPDMTFDEMCAVLAAEYPEVYYLFWAGTNTGAFAFNKNYSLAYYVNYSGVTLTTDNHMIFTAKSTSGAGGGSAIFSKVIDLTNYSKIIIKHDTTLPEASEYTKAVLFTAKTLGLPTTTDSAVALCKFASKSGGEVTLDISSLSGNHFIGIDISMNVTYSTGIVDIEYIYLD